MRHAVLVLSCILAATLSACSNGVRRGQRPGDQGGGQTSKIAPYSCQNPKCDDADALAALDLALKTCTSTQNLYEKRGFNSKRFHFGIALVGALAGAVAAPLAKGSGTAAWSGVSGAANGIQSQFDEQFSYAITVQERAAIADAMTAGTATFQKDHDSFSRVADANIMANNCRVASSKADKAVLDAISSAAAKVQESDKRIIDAQRGSTQSKNIP